MPMDGMPMKSLNSAHAFPLISTTIYAAISEIPAAIVTTMPVSRVRMYPRSSSSPCTRRSDFWTVYTAREPDHRATRIDTITITRRPSATAASESFRIPTKKPAISSGRAAMTALTTLA